MQLKKVTLHNFRCFEKLEVDLHPRLTVIVGDNGAGKTAVLEGICRALNPVLSNLSSANQRIQSKTIQDSDRRIVSLPKWGNKERWGRAETTGVEVQTHEGISWDIWSTAIPGKKVEGAIGRGELKQHLQPIVESYSTANPLPVPVCAYYGASRGSIEVPQRIWRSKINYSHPAAALVGTLEAYADFREMLAWFGMEEKSELMQNKGLTREQSQTLSTLDAVRKAIIALLHEEYQNPHFMDPGHKFVVERRADGAPMLVGQLSQGYRSMLALAMDFARRLAIANQYQPRLNYEPSIMLVDEIDVHLHPTWQQRVLRDLMLAFPNTQFIVTTHSPQVLSTVAREHIRKLQADGSGIKAEMPEFSPLAHESGDALAKVMDTHREPRLPIQDQIRKFEQLVRAGQEQSQEARDLRVLVEQAGYQFHESDLTKWRFLAKNAKHKGI